jgi:hypothetical protein
VDGVVGVLGEESPMRRGMTPKKSAALGAKKEEEDRKTIT